MKSQFMEVFRRYRFLGVTDILSIFKVSTFMSFKKGEIIAREGEYCDYVYLILKGMIRTYVLTPNGTERTIKLAAEKEFTSCGSSFIYGKPSTEFMSAIEDCKVIAINRNKLEELSKENNRILRVLHEAMKEAFYEAIVRIEFFTVLTPEQRYRKLLEDTPQLIQRVPQKYLASYLGITKVSLSRIRNRKNTK